MFGLSGPPAAGNAINTGTLVKQADQTVEGIVWQVYFTGTTGPPPAAASGLWGTQTGQTYWRFFVAVPPTDQDSETLDFQKERDLRLLPAGVQTFLGLTDTPNTYVAEKWCKVNSAGNAIEFVDSPAFTPTQANLYTPITLSLIHI